jgi:dGTPase
VCHDFEDAVAAGIVSPAELPAIVRQRCGDTRREQLAAFIVAVLDGIAHTGRVGMGPEMADALAAFRAFNYERIYLREASRHQGALVIDVLRALVDHFTPERGVDGAVTYVAGMTDRFAFSTAEKTLGWDPRRLPTLG